LGRYVIMKIKKEPTNIYEVVVTETRAVTYLVHAKTSGGASTKAVHHYSGNGSDVKEIKSDRYEYDVESVECLERDTYGDI
jgi:hypothetical protein